MRIKNMRKIGGLVLIVSGVIMTIQSYSLFSWHSYYGEETMRFSEELLSAIEAEDSESYYPSLVSMAMATEGLRSGVSPYAALTGSTTARLYEMGEDLSTILARIDVVEAAELEDILRSYRDSLQMFLTRPFIPILQIFLAIAGIILIVSTKRKERKNDEQSK